MAKDPTTDFIAGFQKAFADAQAKAQATFDKNASAFGEYGEFAKGNVEALVEAGKILASGLQELGSDFVAESRTAFETLTADAKELATAKTPTEFFKAQGEQMRRNFDSAVACSSKNSEALLKLANDALMPISTRISLAVDKVKKAA